MTREEALQHVAGYGLYIEQMDSYAVMFEGKNLVRKEPIELVEEILKRSGETSK